MYTATGVQESFHPTIPLTGTPAKKYTLGSSKLSLSQPRTPYTPIVTHLKKCFPGFPG